MKKKGLSILFSGEAGQGLNTIEKILAKIYRKNGNFVFTSKEIMSRIRGGLNSVLIRVSDDERSGFIRNADIIFSLKKGGIDRLADRMTKNTLLIFDPEKEKIGDARAKKLAINMSELSQEVGGKIFLNVVNVGIVCALTAIEKKTGSDIIAKIFQDKKQEENLKAFAIGFQKGLSLRKNNKIDLSVPQKKDFVTYYQMNGSQAIGIGALAGGCDFISSYPMSPSTGVLMFLAENGNKHGVFVEQAEDEISAINMSLGAWYAGARALITTSGGGFALMSEGLSLSGITETPCVIHIAQRPGPGTGLPTRTEQGDLNLALNSGHGDFVRAIYAPGSIKQAVKVTKRAFDIADEYQIPAIILSDQYFVDSTWMEKEIEIEDISENKIVQSSENYKRYKFCENGISERAIPGNGKGTVRVDSDEHDERGEITEDFEMRIKQVSKRMKRLSTLKNKAIMPELIGKRDSKNILICWGSNLSLAKEIIEIEKREDICALHFSQVYPLNPEIKKFFAEKDRVITLENNLTSQFGELLKKELGIEYTDTILQYNGLPFAIEDVMEKIDEILKGGN